MNKVRGVKEAEEEVVDEVEDVDKEQEEVIIHSRIMKKTKTHQEVVNVDVDVEEEIIEIEDMTNPIYNVTIVRNLATTLQNVGREMKKQEKRQIWWRQKKIPMMLHCCWLSRRRIKMMVIGTLTPVLVITCVVIRKSS